MEITKKQIEETKTLLEVAGYITACARMLIENPLLRHSMQIIENTAKGMEGEEAGEILVNIEGINYFMDELDRETAAVGVSTMEEACLVAAKMRGVTPNEDE